MPVIDKKQRTHNFKEVEWAFRRAGKGRSKALSVSGCKDVTNVSCVLTKQV
jgi:hypothetical protein